MDFIGNSFNSFKVSFRNLKVVESRLRLLIGNPETLTHMRENFEHNLEKINLFHQDIIQYEPHITLGKTMRDYRPPSMDFSNVGFQVKEIGLYETIRGETAAEFKLLKSSHLK